MSGFKAKRISREFTFNVKARPPNVFPLLCPVREYDWIPNWSCEMIYSESGVAEFSCVFRTGFLSGDPEVWVVSRYEPDNHTIGFVIHAPGSHTEKLDIRVEDPGDGTSRLYWTRTYTGLSDKGNEFLETLAGEALTDRMARLESALNHYCKTGQMLPPA